MFKTIQTAIENQQVTETKSREIYGEFLAGEPGAALKRLVELRSGSISDQSFSAAKVEDIEDRRQNFSWVYRWFFSLVLITTDKDKCICLHFLRSNAIDFIMRELQSSTFTNYKNKSPPKSQTATIIVILLGIIHNISIEGIFQTEVFQQLENGKYFQVLEFYLVDRSVPF